MVRWKSVALWSGIALAQFGAARFGLQFITMGDSVSPIWPASGLALAVLLLAGRSYWPAVLLGSFLANMASPVPIWVTLFTAVGSTAAAWLGVCLMKHRSFFQPSMERLVDVLSLSMLGGLLSCGLAATLGVLTLAIAGKIAPGNFLKEWFVWLSGDVMGVMIVTPFLLTWLSPTQFRVTRRTLPEFAALLAGSLVVCWTAFTWTGSRQIFDYPFGLAPFVMWAALRFGPRGASTLTLLIAGFGVWAVAHQAGFLTSPSMKSNALLLQAFLAVTWITGQMLAALTAQQKRTEQRLLNSEQHHRQLFDQNPQILLVYDRETLAFLSVNKTARNHFGYQPEDYTGMKVTDLVREADREEAARRFHNVGDEETLSGTWNLVSGGHTPVYAGLSFQKMLFDQRDAVLVLVEDITERMRADENLRRYERKLTLHIEQTAIAVIEWDRDFHVVEWNPAAEKIFGYIKWETIGKNGPSLIVPAHLIPQANEIWNQIIHGSEPVRFSNENITKDGSIIHCEWFNTPLIDSHGEVMGVASLVQDVTQREHAALALRESEQRLRSIIDSFPMGIHLLELHDDDQLILIGANPACTSIFGVDSAELLGKPFEEAFPAMVDTQIPRMYRETARQGKTWWTDQVVYDGDRIFGAFEVNAFRTTPGKLVALYVDVTERRRAEEALRLRDKAMGAIAQGIAITSRVTSAGTPFIYANPAFQHLTGYGLDELAGKNWKILAANNTDPDDLDTIESALIRQQTCSVDLQCCRKDGTHFLTTISVSPIPDHEGRISHFVWVFTDVTAIRNLESQFRQSQKMEAIGRLAGGVAHDFNNLLTAIIGYNDLILSELGFESPLSGHSREVRKAAERAAALTGQLLAFSRQQAMVPQRMDINRTIRGMLGLLRRLIGENIRVDTSLASHAGEIKAEPTQIEQVIMNLAINARDAMPDGGTLALRTGRTRITPIQANATPGLAAGDYVQITVTDTGHGMDDTVREHLFEPFFTTKEKGKGTGLGLATCYGIITQTGGHIHVQSVPGRGTSFEILIPRLDPETTPEPMIPTENPARGGGETILVAEDDMAVRPLTTSILKSLGYRVMEAENGLEAKRRITEHGDQPIQLLLTDVVMPVMGGKELADWMRKNRPDTRILFTSGYLENALSIEDMGDSEQTFLQKPFTPLALAKKVREVLDRE